MSITGFRLANRASQVFFYRQPRRQASTKCPLPALKQLNFWMQILSQLSRFMNWSIDHCDLDFLLIACVITRWSYRGHEAVIEDAMLKGGGGVCGSICPWLWRRRVESAVEAGRENKFQAMCCPMLPGWLKRADEPKSCLVDWNGLMSPKLRGSVIFSASLLQLRVD